MLCLLAHAHGCVCVCVSAFWTITQCQNCNIKEVWIYLQKERTG